MSDVAAAQRAWSGHTVGDDAMDWTPGPEVAAALAAPAASTGQTTSVVTTTLGAAGSHDTRLWDPVPHGARAAPSADAPSVQAPGAPRTCHGDGGGTAVAAGAIPRPWPPPVSPDALATLFRVAQLDYHGPGAVYNLLDHLILRLERLGDDRLALGTQAPPVTGHGIHTLVTDFRLAVRAAELAWREALDAAP